MIFTNFTQQWESMSHPYYIFKMISKNSTTTKYICIYIFPDKHVATVHLWSHSSMFVLRSSPVKEIKLRNKTKTKNNVIFKETNECL